MRLGLVHPSRLFEQLTGSEVMDWWHYYLAEPWGEPRQDARALWLAQLNSGDGLDAAVTWPSCVAEIYQDPGLSAEFQEQLNEVRRARSHGNG